MTLARLVLALVLAVVAMAASAVAATAPAKLSPCAVMGKADAALCGVVEVPENHAAPGGKTLSLRVLVLPSVGPETLPPVYELAGGPGLAASDGAIFYLTDGAAWRAGRRIVLADMRGTGGSAPLRCPELEAGKRLERMYPPAAVRDCRAALVAGGADLAHYTTLATAKDLDLVRRALGDKRIDLFAMSYGTMLAQTYVRLHPDRVGAAVLEGAVPLGEKLPLNHGRNAQRTLTDLFADCQAEAACAAAFPDLPGDWRRLLARLDAGPVPVSTPAGIVQAEKGPVLEALRAMMTTSAGQSRLPMVIHQAAKGDFAPLGAGSGVGGPGLAEGLYLSIACIEGTGWITPDEAAAAGQASDFGAYRVEEQVAACRLWGVDRREGRALPAPLTGPRMLLIAGERDHVAPPAWADEVARLHPGARVVRIEKLSHGIEGVVGVECFDQISLTFLAAGTLSDADLACVNTMKAPPFLTAPPKAP